MTGFNPLQVFYKRTIGGHTLTGYLGFNPLQVFYKLCPVLAAVTQTRSFQSLIGILQTYHRLLPLSSAYPVSIPYRYSTNTIKDNRRAATLPVSIPYRYSTNVLSSNSLSPVRPRFNPLQVFYKPFYYRPSKHFPGWFQSLIGILQTWLLIMSTIFASPVSIPYRYSTNNYYPRHSSESSMVSIPYRYSTNQPLQRIGN